jgi:hypothetical protein
VGLARLGESVVDVGRARGYVCNRPKIGETGG